MQTNILEVSNVSKSFPGVQALSNVNLHLRAGEVLAVIGENGAGKSTLMKILAGLQTPDQGHIKIDDQTVWLANTRQAMSQGIFLIHQELNLVENQSVAANIYLGHEPHRWGLIDSATINKKSAEVLQKIGLDVSPKTIVGNLTIGKQQMVEIAKAVSANARILIMDEPTSSLSSRETETLFEVVDDLRNKGVAIIYISHRLREVKRLADRVSVLRDGENAGELSKQEIDHGNMVRMMVGRDISQFYARKQHEIGDVLLEVENLSTEAWPHCKLNFQIRAGEIVGVAGLVGAGRTEMLRVLFGVDAAVTGTVNIAGKKLFVDTPRTAIRNGIALVPEDRKQHGLMLEMSVRNNVGLPGLSQFRRMLAFINFAREKQDTDNAIEQLQIRTPDSKRQVKFLSGGNQQKVVIGKWLALGPKLLLLDEPTRGVDVGAKEEIYKLMEKLAQQGMGILFVSSEMEEILGMSDRVLVMHEGEISGELKRDELNEEAIMQLATGNVMAVG